MATIGESVSKRKGDGQRELQEEAGKSKKRSVAACTSSKRFGCVLPRKKAQSIIRCRCDMLVVA